MSDIPITERDAAGRFKKTDAADTPVAADNDTMHPMATLLFGWVQSRQTPSMLLGAVLVLSLGLIAADLTLDRDGPFGLASLTGFYGFFSLAVVGLTILLGWPFSRLLRRSEDFYGEGDETPLGPEDEEPAQ